MLFDDAMEAVLDAAELASKEEAAMEAMLDAAELASKNEAAVEAVLDAAEHASKEDETMLDAAQLASEEHDAQIVQWEGRFDPAVLKRTIQWPYTFVKATYDGTTFVTFYMDRSGGRHAPTEALSNAAFGCAVELGLRVSFSAARRPQPQPRRACPTAHLSEHQKAALQRTVEVAQHLFESSSKQVSWP